MGDRVQGKPGTVVSSDLRLAAAALLMASDGEVLGQATVLSPDLAVTTAEVAQYANAKMAGLSSSSNSGFGPLAISFPQFFGAPGLNPLRARIEAIDSELGFAIVRFYGMLPTPVPTGLLGAGDSPEIGTTCDIFYSDPSWDAFYQVAGDLRSRAGARLRLGLSEVPDEPLATALTAAPVFAGFRFIGIVLTASSGVADVVSLDGMAQSRATPAVPSLLPWIDPEPSSATPGAAVSTSAENKSQMLSESPTSNDPSLRSAGRTNESVPRQVVLNAEVFRRLSVSATNVLERANGMRIAMGLNEVHMEERVLGMFEKYDGPRAGDEAWKKIVKGLGPGSWEAQSFRAFLALGESLGKSAGHGLW